MGYAAIGQTAGERWERYEPYSWQFVLHEPHPVTGEPFPTPKQILWKLRELYDSRVSKLYEQSDGIRASLVEYGIVIECERDRVRAKW